MLVINTKNVFPLPEFLNENGSTAEKTSVTAHTSSQNISALYVMSPHSGPNQPASRRALVHRKVTYCIRKTVQRNVLAIMAKVLTHVYAKHACQNICANLTEANLLANVTRPQRRQAIVSVAMLQNIHDSEMNVSAKHTSMQDPTYVALRGTRKFVVARSQLS